MMTQSAHRPPGMRIVVALQTGKTLQTSARNCRLFAIAGDMVCVELRQRTGREEPHAVLTRKDNARIFQNGHYSVHKRAFLAQP